MTYHEKLTKLSLNIAYFRKSKNMSKDKLAELSGISVSFLGKLEAPNTFVGISFEVICKLADALEITESQLFDFR